MMKAVVCIKTEPKLNNNGNLRNNPLLHTASALDPSSEVGRMSILFTTNTTLESPQDDDEEDEEGILNQTTAED